MDPRRDLERRLEVMAEIVSLPRHFPLLRPTGEAFDAWVAAVGPVEDPPDALLDQGLELLGPGGRKAVVRAFRDEHPEIWSELSSWVGDELLSESLLVIGSIAASLGETRRLEADVLGLIEELDVLGEPAEALAVALERMGLWSAAEAAWCDAVLGSLPKDALDEERWNRTVREQAARLGTDRHAERLERLVARVHGQLPLEGYGRASKILADGCATFSSDPTFREQVAAILLANAVCRLAALPSDDLAA